MIKLKQLPNGGCDVEMDDAPGETGAVQTVVLALLFTDQRAPAEREPDAYARRGWWADPDSGTGLWHVRRQALTRAARLETVRIVQEALQREPALDAITVVDVGPPGSISDLQLAVGGQHNGRQFLMDLTLNADSLPSTNI